MPLVRGRQAEPEETPQHRREGGQNETDQVRTKERERDEGHQVGGPEPPFSSPIPLFHDRCCPPGERSEGPDRGTRARTRRPTRGRAAPRGCRSPTAQGNTHKKESGVVSGQGQIPAWGNRSRAVPRRHFLPHSNPLCPPNMAASPRRRLLLPPQARSSAGHPSRWASRALEEHAKPRRTAARRAPPRPRRPGDAERPAGGGSHGGRHGRSVGSPALTSCSTRGSSAPREKRK